MSELSQDVRQSLRWLARNPAFTMVAVLTLAIALGANTAVFSLIDGVLLRALPYPEPDRLVDVSISLPPAEGQPGRKAFLDSQELAAWSRSARTVEQLAAYSTRSFTLRGEERTERLTGASVSTALFPLLGVAPAHGRAFREAEGRPGAERVVLLSYELWRRRFQGDSEIVGRTLILEGASCTVVGVMPEGFSFPRPEIELWAPLTVEAPAPQGASVLAAQYAPVVARLRDGVALEQAEAEAQTLLDRLGEGAAEEAPRGRVRLVPLRDEIVAPVRPALLVTSAAVGLVLLIACIDLAGLLLMRNTARQREMAIRSALGGGRARLVRQMLTESTVLALAGGIAGMLVAVWLQRLLPRLLPHDIPRLEEIRLDPRVFLFAFSLAAVTGLASGLLPALRGARTSLVAPLQGGAADASPGQRGRSSLVVAEIALAFVLLVGAGLLARSFQHLVGLDLGYQPDRVLTATLELAHVRDGRDGGAERSAAFLDELLGRLATHAGVEAAGVVSFAPLAPGFSLTSFALPGAPPARSLAVPQTTSPGYLRAMGMRLSQGRWLTPEDLATEAPVVVVNETFARQYLTGRKVLGRQLEVGSASLEIVGVLADVRLLGLESAAKPELFTSYRQAKAFSGAGPERLTLAVRTAGDPSRLAPDLRTLVHELDPNIALADVEPMRAKLSASLAQPRFYALLLAVFAGLALALAAAGVYGVLSYAVARQTRAIGVRRALGARRRDLLALILGKGLLLTTTGLAIGMAVAAGATRVLTHLLFGVTARDPISYLLAALALAAVATLACYLPARRAILVSPVEALRHDR